VSKRLQFAEIDEWGTVRSAGYAPYLDYRPLATDEETLVAPLRDLDWLKDGLEERILQYVVTQLVPEHLAEVRGRTEEFVMRARAAVQDRLTKEIIHWDHRELALEAQEQAGKTPRLNSANARQRANELEARLGARLKELDQERQLSALPPVALGGTLVIPAGLLAKLKGETTPSEPDAASRDTVRVELLAMDAVMAAERHLGFEPRDVSALKCGYDIESHVPGDGRLRFIEVKGRAVGATTVTVTRNEILTALNKPEDFILAIVEVDGTASTPHYVRRPFHKEPDFGVTSVNYELKELLGKSTAPHESVRGYLE
jgi:hypothetical protein